MTHSRGFASCQDPADDGGEGGHAEEDEHEVTDRNVSQRRDAAVQGVAADPPDHADVAAKRSEEGAEEAEGPGRDGGQRAAGEARGTGGRERSEIARRLASHQTYRH